MHIMGEARQPNGIELIIVAICHPFICSVLRYVASGTKNTAKYMYCMNIIPLSRILVLIDN